MPTIDLQDGYKTAEGKIKALKVYKDAKKQYDNTKKKVGDTYETKKQNVTKKLSNIKKEAKDFERKVKSQFDHLLDLSKMTSNVGSSNSSKYIKKKFLQAFKVIEPKIMDIIFSESLKAIGCDQNQTYATGQKVYIKLKSLDLANLLKINPDDKIGKALYEKTPVTGSQTIPFSMNRELFNRTQSQNDYAGDFGQDYYGASGRHLFNIKFVETNPATNEGGGWYEMTFADRGTSVNTVKQFAIDYYKSIRLFEKQNLMAWIMESLCGAVSMNIGAGDFKLDDMSGFMQFIQRILGLCFDTRSEIEVATNSKVSQNNGFDESFYELNEVDLRHIEQRVNNIKKGVAKFESCGEVEIPVNFQGIADELEKITFVKDEDFVNSAEKLTNNEFIPPPEGLGIDFNVDDDFLKAMIKGFVIAIFSPKVLLPILGMTEALYGGATYGVDSYKTFMKKNKQYVKNVISKIGALFVQALFEIIKQDIIALVKSVIEDLLREKLGKKYEMIKKLIAILAIFAKLIQDWRACKSVVDEILQLLELARQAAGFSINRNKLPLPLLFASEFLDGYSETRAFIDYIDNLEKLGIPTGAMPDGSPNLSMLSSFAQMKSSSLEDAQNGKVQIAIGPLSMTPAGLTVPASAFGKKF